MSRKNHMKFTRGLLNPGILPRGELMKHARLVFWRAVPACLVLLAVVVDGATPVPTNPSGGTVLHGTASFNSQGSQFTIRASDGALINWQNFNIGLGQTTT